ncbi:MAG TPA: hypothetical protein VKZ98_00920 [Aquaticitalea sp.]|nr:hypothetical protein [Aquaticitalea sp.]
METSDNIIDSTLDVVGDSMNTFDNTLGKVPLYKAGHNVGGAISRFIDRFVDHLPIP